VPDCPVVDIRKSKSRCKGESGGGNKIGMSERKRQKRSLTYRFTRCRKIFPHIGFFPEKPYICKINFKIEIPYANSTDRNYKSPSGKIFE
jgi:hypothetical protein